MLGVSSASIVILMFSLFSEPISLFRFIELEGFLGDRLGVRVDLVMRDALKPRIRESIIGEVVYA